MAALIRNSRSTGWSGDGRTHAVDFTVDRAVRVTGYGVYGPYRNSQQSYTVRKSDTLINSNDSVSLQLTAKLSLGSVELAKKGTTDTVQQAEEIVKVEFDKPVKVRQTSGDVDFIQFIRLACGVQPGRVRVPCSRADRCQAKVAKHRKILSKNACQ